MQSTQPMTRFGLVQSLIEQVYGGSDTLLQRSIKELVEKNNALVKDHFSGYRYDGQLFGKLTVSKQTPILKPSLVDEHKQILKEYGFNGTIEFKKVHHFFVTTTNKTMSYPELKVLYPDGLHQVLVQFQDILVVERVQSDEWLDKQLRLFHDVRESILHRLCLNLLITS